MLLRDIGLDVDRVLCTEREPGIHQCTFIFECNYESEAIDKMDELFSTICEQSERRFTYTEVGIGDPDVVVSKMRVFECSGDILLQEKDNGKWMVLMVGIQKPWRPDQKMESVG